MLKNCICIFSVLLLSYSVYAQDYLIDFENLTWQEHYAPVPTRAVHNVYTEGDSLINGKQYDLIYRQGICSYTPFPNPVENCLVQPPELHVGIRQDAGRVYAIELDTNSVYYNQEYLLMDFNLAIGDTMYITSDAQFFIKIADIYYSDDGRKIYSCFLSNYFFGDSPYVRWIEGIGSSVTLKYWIGPPHWYSTCFILDGEYMDPEIDAISGSGCPCDACLEDVTTVEDEALDAFYLYPNPTTQELNIAGIDISDLENYEIVDLKGNSYAMRSMSKNQLKFDVSNLNSQLYFFRILLKDNQRKTVKFIKY